MTLRWRLIGLAVGVAASGVCSPGCARRPAADVHPVTLRIGVGVPLQGKKTAGINALVDLLSTEALVTNAPDGRQTERLATNWSWNPERTVLRLTLRHDVLFHDGTKLTPEIVAQSLKESAAAPDAFFSLKSIAGVTAAGPDTVDITLTERNSFLLPDLSLTSLRVPGHREIGTGPFRLVTSGEHSVLRAFDQYYRGRPALDSVEVELYPTQRNAWTAMLRGELGMLYEVSRDAVEFVEAETTVNTYSFPRAYYIPLVFNVRHPILKNKEVRRAINEAIDRSTLIAAGMRGRGNPADGPIWPAHWAYTDSHVPVTFNPDAARLRLDGAGLPIHPGTGGARPSRFSITCLVMNDSRFERLSMVLQKQLAEVGIDLQLTPVTFREFGERAGKGDFDTFLFEMAGGRLSWIYAFWHSPTDPESTLINTGYDSGDAVLDRIRHAGTDDEIRTGVADLMRVFHDDPPAAFLAWQVTSRAVSTAFDVSPDRDRDIFMNVWQWRLGASQKLASR